MKNFKSFGMMLFALLLSITFVSCGKINQKFTNLEQRFDNVDRRIDRLENTTIASVNNQILNIQNSIPGIEQTVHDLNNYVTLLKNENVVGFTTSITNIEQYASNLNVQLTEIRNYTQKLINQENVSNDVWVEISLQTLNLYRTIQNQMSLSKSEITNVTKIINDLNISVNQQILDYNVSLTTLINQTEVSMMKWVNERFTAYYTIAEIDARIQNLIIENNVEINNSINALIIRLNAMDIDISNLYEKFIFEAITYLDGSISEMMVQKIEEATISLNVSIESITTKITEIENRILVIDNSINTVNQQITAINVSIEEMVMLQEQITQYITVLQEEGDTYNTQIILLQQIYSELSVKIEELNVYVAKIVNDFDISISETKNWVSVTFATIEQYNAISATIINIQAMVAVIQTSIETINQTIVNINTDITNIQNIVNISIQNIDSSTREWVNKKLVEYLTINDAMERLATMKADLEKQIAEVRIQIEYFDDEFLSDRIAELEKELAGMKKEMTEVVYSTIEKSIYEYDGNIYAELDALKEAIASIQTQMYSMEYDFKLRLENLYAEVNAYIEKILSDFYAFRNDIYESIQSIAHIPTYSDGSVSISAGECQLQFEVLPISAAREIASKKMIDCLSFDVVNVQTRAGSSSNTATALKVAGVSMDGDFLVVTVNFASLSDAVFNGKQSVMGRLKIDYRQMSKASEYFTLVPVK